MNAVLRNMGLGGMLATLMGCSSHPPMQMVDYVDLDRFMGDWYVIANIPTSIEKNAHNAVERYVLNDDGTVATTFTFNEGGYDGTLKRYEPKGYIKNSDTNALWGMQFVWPIKADYRIVYLDEAYSRTIIARKARDYVWIMARSPSITEAQYQEMISFIDALGYDISKLERVPQRWETSKEEKS